MDFDKIILIAKELIKSNSLIIVKNRGYESKRLTLCYTVHDEKSLCPINIMCYPVVSDNGEVIHEKDIAIDYGKIRYASWENENSQDSNDIISIYKVVKSLYEEHVTEKLLNEFESRGL